MSQYQPRAKNLRVVKQDNGYMIYDKYGPFDGPYTFSDAIAVIASYERDPDEWRDQVRDDKMWDE